ncbi:hypothetical protein L596_006311 [Steinernema carpocapsae]|uniref:Uncharacterized protein n=1 Tax=Steinernema carpocapsae TaxID=34508 RepID=A0A4V6I8R4_STECR|nr:hypothetical protein L596_006311 [Steinernema carpocapsae]
MTKIDSETPKLAKNHPILQVSPRLSPDFSNRFEKFGDSSLYTNGVDGLVAGGVQTRVAVAHEFECSVTVRCSTNKGMTPSVCPEI